MSEEKLTTPATTDTPSTPSFQLFDDPLKLSASQHLKLALSSLSDIDPTPIKKVKLNNSLSDRSKYIFNNLSLDEMQAKLKEANYFHSIISRRVKEIEEYIAQREAELRTEDQEYNKSEHKFNNEFYYFKLYQQKCKECEELAATNKQLEKEYSSLKEQWAIVNNVFHTEMKKYEE